MLCSNFRYLKCCTQIRKFSFKTDYLKAQWNALTPWAFKNQDFISSYLDSYNDYYETQVSKIGKLITEVGKICYPDSRFKQSDTEHTERRRLLRFAVGVLTGNTLESFEQGGSMCYETIAGEFSALNSKVFMDTVDLADKEKQFTSNMLGKTIRRTFKEYTSREVLPKLDIIDTEFEVIGFEVPFYIFKVHYIKFTPTEFLKQQMRKLLFTAHISSEIIKCYFSASSTIELDFMAKVNSKERFYLVPNKSSTIQPKNKLYDGLNVSNYSDQNSEIENRTHLISLRMEIDASHLMQKQTWKYWFEKVYLEELSKDTLLIVESGNIPEVKNMHTFVSSINTVGLLH